jgi:mannosyl-3-phosphoglycerate phosphatase
MKTILYSDIDGTLLTEDYSFEETKLAVARLLSEGVAVVLCSSKTKPEIEFYREKMRINDPFISENGAALYIPKDYFSHPFPFSEETDKFKVIALGVPYRELRKALKRIAEKTGTKIVGFGDLNVEEIAIDACLSLEQAILAKQRAFDEPFRIIEGDEKEVLRAVIDENLSLTKGGRYHHLSGNHDKGTALKCLTNLYAENFGQTRTVAVGNSENDLAMLKAADTSFFIEETDRLRTIWEKIVKSII